MSGLLEGLNIIWGRVSYLIGVPVQEFGVWAWQHTAYYLLAPELALLCAVLAICLLEVFSKRDNYLLATWVAIIGLLINFSMTIHMMYYTSRYFSYGLSMWWGGLETIDPYAIFFKQLLDWGDILLCVALINYKPMKQYRVEFIILVLLGTIAFDLMVGSSDLLAVYVMTEFGGICGYILAAFYKHELRSLEAGLKYFVTGATSSTALLFAMSIFYGAVNSTNMYDIKNALAGGGALLPPIIFSIVLMLVAIGYKVGLAPFHLWVADVYEGAPTPVAAFIAVFPKVAGYAVLLRLLFIPFASLRQIWVPVLMVMAVLSMVFGNVMAMRQTSFKRLMAFSGVAHMGYIMIGVIAASYSTREAAGSLGFRAAMYYMLVYFFMNLGAFVVAMIVETYGGTDHLDSYNGLYRRNPPLAILMTILLAALIGLPPTCGFWAKFHVFTSLTGQYTVLSNQVLLALAALTTAIGAYYYLKLAYRMFILPPAPEASRYLKPPLFMRLAVSIPTILILALGLFYVNVPYNYVKESWFLETLTPGTAI